MFERVIEDSRIRKTKLIPAGLSAREADELGRKWDAEIYAIATGARRPIVTIEECIRIHVGDRSAGWTDRKTRIQILTKYAPEYEEQDALDLYDWSIKFAGFMRANVDRQGRPKKPMSDGTIHNTFGYIRAAIKYTHKIGSWNTTRRRRWSSQNRAKSATSIRGAGKCCKSRNSPQISRPEPRSAPPFAPACAWAKFCAQSRPRMDLARAHEERTPTTHSDPSPNCRDRAPCDVHHPTVEAEGRVDKSTH